MTAKTITEEKKKQLAEALEKFNAYIKSLGIDEAHLAVYKKMKIVNINDELSSSAAAIKD